MITSCDLILDQIDLGIRVGIPTDDSLVARVMYEQCFSIYASPEYLEREGKPNSVREIEKHQWITLSQFERNGLPQFRQRGKLIDVQPEHYQMCNSPLMLQQMVVS